MADYDLSSVVTYVNAQGNRYARACNAIYDLLGKTKLTKDDKQDLLSDLSDLLDNMPASPRSGFTERK
jgi:hypothetical protein